MATTTGLQGAAAMRAKLLRLQQKFPDLVGRALYQEAQIEKTKSMRRTPVQTGTLKASHQVSDPEYAGRSITVAISVGGAAEAYAWIVHEDLNALHKNGQAKFLESTLMESAPYIGARVASRIKLADGL